MNQKELEHRLKIDREKLDEECSEHAELYHLASLEAGKAKMHLDICKWDTDYTKAVVAHHLRTMRNDEGKKMTEKAIESEVLLDEKVVNAQTTLMKAHGEFVEWRAILDAFEHRRSMLNNTVELIKSGYMHYGDGPVSTSRLTDMEREIGKTRERRRREKEA